MLAAEEDIRPYERPPLSKEYLQGKTSREKIFVHSPDWYDTNRVELLLGTAVTGIDRSRREVTLTDGGHLAYGKLLLATGSVPRPLPLPGPDADGVLCLRRAAGPARWSIRPGSPTGRTARSGRCHARSEALVTTGTGAPPALAAADAQFLTELGQQLRADSIRYTAELAEPGARKALARLRALAVDRPVTLLTATGELDLSQAAVLAGLLRETA